MFHILHVSVRFKNQIKSCHIGYTHCHASNAFHQTGERVVVGVMRGWILVLHKIRHLGADCIYTATRLILLLIQRKHTGIIKITIATDIWPRDNPRFVRFSPPISFRFQDAVDRRRCWFWKSNIRTCVVESKISAFQKSFTFATLLFSKMLKKFALFGVSEFLSCGQWMPQKSPPLYGKRFACSTSRLLFSTLASLTC